MNRPESKKLTLRILTLVLLLAAQGIGHAHQVDHVLPDDGYSCGICSLTTQHDDVVAENFNQSPVPLPGLKPLQKPARQLVSRITLTLRARSPPRSN